MSSASVLKEFLVRIGFKVDEGKYRNFQERVSKTSKSAIGLTKNFAELGKASVVAGTAIGATLTLAASKLETLYFASQRTGASAKQLQTFSFAASQIGVNAEQAQSALESLAQMRALNPAANGLLAQLGIDPSQTDNAKVMLEILQRLHSMPMFMGAKYAQMLGIDPATFRQMELNLPQMLKAARAANAVYSEGGISQKQQAEQSHEFMLRVRQFQARLKLASDTLTTRMEPAGATILGWTDEATRLFLKADKATNGWSTRIIGLTIALKSLTTTVALFRKLKRLTTTVALFRKLGSFGAVGRAAAGAEGAEVAGAGVAAGEGAAVAGAEGAGAGILGVIGLPAIIIAAVSAALVWMSLHPDKVRKAAAAIWHAGVNEAKALPGQVRSAAHGISSAAHVLGWKGLFETIAGTVAPGLTGFVSTLAGKTSNFIANYEGIMRKATWDYKGYSIGYGHQIQPGEHFSGPISNSAALKLLVADTAKSIHAVLSMVKVKLNANQLEALTDFEYNVGKSAFAGSTLLKMLNEGNYAGAAEQFSRWNKVLVNGHYEVNSGLAARRAADARLFSTADSKALALHQETNIYIDGSKDPKATGQEVARQQNRTNGDLVRNFEGAVR